MTHVLSNMLWLDRKELGETECLRLMREFTIVGTATFQGEDPPVAKLYSLTPKYLGIPRSRSGGYSYRDNTVMVGARPAWPEVQFPNDGDWREGQEDVISDAVNYFKNGHLGGRVEAKCGFGKVLVGLAVAQQLNARVCVLVHKEDLATQWQEDAAMFFPGVCIGHIQGNKWAYKNAHVVTCMAQTLWARRGKYPPGFASEFDMIIVDEGHRFAAETFAHVLKVFGARYRLGVSATWRRNDGLDRVWDYQIGPVITRGVSESLVGQYVFVSPNIELRGIHAKTPRARVLNALGKSEAYATWLAQEAYKAADRGRKILVVSDRINLLDRVKYHLQRELHRCGIRKTVGMYTGSSNGKAIPKTVLTAALKADIILSTYSMINEGTDCPALDTLFIATPRSDVEQVVGRIQRIHSDKKQLLIVDPVLTGHPLFQGSARKRLRMYKQLGFKAPNTQGHCK